VSSLILIGQIILKVSSLIENEIKSSHSIAKAECIVRFDAPVQCLVEHAVLTIS
jgi:hypothetical protein